MKLNWGVDDMNNDPDFMNYRGSDGEERRKLCVRCDCTFPHVACASSCLINSLSLF